MTRRHWVHPIAAARRATRRRIEGDDEAGFTLIELIVTIAILPIVVGGISVALISVFSLQGSVTNRISDSNDSLVASVYFNRDVQSAERMTTSPTVACGPTPAPTNPAQTQLLGLEWGANTSAPGGYDSVVSYVSVPEVNTQTNATTYKMLRQVCSYAAGSTLNLTSTITVANDIGSAPTSNDHRRQQRERHELFRAERHQPIRLEVGAGSDRRHLPDHRTRQPILLLTDGTPGRIHVPELRVELDESHWTRMQLCNDGLLRVNKLCFADFTGVTNPPLQSSGKCQTVTRPIANTPYSLTFCISVVRTMWCRRPFRRTTARRATTAKRSWATTVSTRASPATPPFTRPPAGSPRSTSRTSKCSTPPVSRRPVGRS